MIFIGNTVEYEKYFRDVVRPILIFTFSLVLVGSILMLIEPNDSVFRF